MSLPTTNNSQKPRFKKRLLILLLVLLAVVGLVVWLAGGFSREPLHKGKPISYWVDHACVSDTSKAAWDFRKEVQKIGPTAIPYLVQKMRTPDGLRDAWRWLRTRLPLRLQKRFPDVRSGTDIREGAAMTAGLFGAEAAPAVPDIARLLPGTQNAIISALTSIGPAAQKALPALHAALTNRNTTPMQRLSIANAAWHIGRETNLVLQVCTNALVPGASDAATMNACAFLVSLGAAAQSATPFALRVLQDTNYSPDTRGNAAVVLGAAGVASPEICAALLDTTETKQVRAERLRLECGLALWRLDPQYAPRGTRLVLASIVASKRQSAKSERDFIASLKLRQLDPNESIPALKQLLESDSAEMRKEAAEALRRIEGKIDLETK